MLVRSGFRQNLATYFDTAIRREFTSRRVAVLHVKPCWWVQKAIERVQFIGSASYGWRVERRSFLGVDALPVDAGETVTLSCLHIADWQEPSKPPYRTAEPERDTQK
ncbi:hypothetical protein Bbelb_306010 [Branchiostoma belcheri]|nr:hypothetical protein Bbelb_306010 [Branchiostoma belcheri]